jgi:hypothetical protein
MANDSHLSVLKRGVEAWNQWREQNPSVKPDLSDAKLREADLRGANLRGSILVRADLRGANLSRADFTGADLGAADLSRADLRGAVLIGANLRGADLGAADLGAADLTRADLTRAVLIGASLWRNALDGVNFEGATIGYTSLGDVDLSSCIGLDSVEHRAPSTLGVDSIVLSEGRIPEIFLRKVGLPHNWIKEIPSLAGASNRFFSCFISYSSLDKLFANRLYDALQAKRIPCWLDEKELVPGKPISEELERAIDSREKFLLCASKNSLTSDWVEDEIETALAIERALRKERGKPVLKLIPLNLDGYMFTPQWDLGVLANEIRGRFAADFGGWETDDAKFNNQVNRVIKALRADEGAQEPPPPPKL